MRRAIVATRGRPQQAQQLVLRQARRQVQRQEERQVARRLQSQLRLPLPPLRNLAQA